MSRQARVRSLPQTPPVVLGMVMLAALAAIGGARASDEGYAEMLGYLAQTRIDGQALTGSRGAIAVNMSAGDLNQQANLRAIAVGANAHAQVDLRQRSENDTYDLPLHASATLGGSALSGAGGIASINQASGSGNAQLNAVSLALAEQDIREAPDKQLSSDIGNVLRLSMVPGGP